MSAGVGAGVGVSVNAGAGEGAAASTADIINASEAGVHADMGVVTTPTVDPATPNKHQQEHENLEPNNGSADSHGHLRKMLRNSQGSSTPLSVESVLQAKTATRPKWDKHHTRPY